MVIVLYIYIYIYIYIMGPSGPWARRPRGRCQRAAGGPAEEEGLVSINVVTSM